VELLHGSDIQEADSQFRKALPDQKTGRQRDPLLLLGRALVLARRGTHEARARAWLELLASCPSGAQNKLCPVVRQVALGRLLGLDEGPREPRTRRLLGPMVRRGAPLTRDLALQVLVRLARREGDVASMRRLAHERGCPPAWRVSGPIHRNATIDLHRPVRHDGSGRKVRTVGCRLQLRSHRKLGGVYWATTRVALDRRQRLLLTVESGGPWQLSVNGRELWTHGDGPERAARRATVAFSLPAGRHRLGLKVGSATGYEELRVALASTTESGVRFSLEEEAPENTARARDVTGVGCGAWKPPGSPNWYAPLWRFLSAEVAVRCKDLDRAYGELAVARGWAPGFVEPRSLLASVMLSDPALPRTTAEDEAGRLWKRILREDALDAEAISRLGDLTLRQGHPEAALKLFQLGASTWPGEARWEVGKHRVSRERSHSTLEERALERAVRLAPSRCDLLDQLAGVKRHRKDVQARLALTLLARRCDRSSAVYARFLRGAGRLAEAAREYRRVLQLRGDADHLRRDLAEVLSLLGRGSEAERELRGLLEASPGSVDDHVARADMLAASGRRQLAVRTLRQAVHSMPWQRELRRTLERLTGQSVMERHRVDGRKVVAAFLAARPKHRHTAPAVVVQDRLVTRFFEDGAALSLTHNIVQVLTKKGMERWGEAEIPEDAEILTLRTVKPDGTTREPEDLSGKRTISLPDLSRGDFVEMETIEARSPPEVYEGLKGPRFFFASFEVPLWRSEYIVVAPAGMPVGADRRAGAPSARTTTRGGLVEHRWLARGVARVVAEPASVPAEEYLPSVRVLGPASWLRLRDHYREQALGAARGSWLTRQAARRITRGLKTRKARARVLYNWVLAEVEAAGPALGSASVAVASGRGSRFTALLTLLRQAGVPAELWLARPVTAAGGRGSDVPEAEGFKRPLVRCLLEDGEQVFLEPTSRHVPFGYVSPTLGGAVALRLAEGAPLGRVRRSAPTFEGRRLDLRIVVGADGSGRCDAVERLGGLWAQRWREALDSIERGRLREAFEQRFLGVNFPGASLSSVKVKRGRVEHPLELRYSFRLPNLCRLEGGRLRCPAGFLAPSLQRRYVKLSRRRHPLMVGLHPPTVVELTVSPPRGYRLAAAPPRIDLSTTHGSLKRGPARRSEGGQVRQRHALRVEQRRVSKKSFPGFARFARRVDRALDDELEFERVEGKPRRARSGATKEPARR
jgi:tetratricopeptide (TPR) repeat protein